MQRNSRMPFFIGIRGKNVEIRPALPISRCHIDFAAIRQHLTVRYFRGCIHDGRVAPDDFFPQLIYTTPNTGN